LILIFDPLKSLGRTDLKVIQNAVTTSSVWLWLHHQRGGSIQKSWHFLKLGADGRGRHPFEVAPGSKLQGTQAVEIRQRLRGSSLSSGLVTLGVR
jgi:hypothetical protein